MSPSLIILFLVLRGGFQDDVCQDPHDSDTS